MATLYEKLRADIIQAVKARDSAVATALRTADAAIQKASIDRNVPIDDALVLATLRKAVKNLADAKEEFARGGRADLVAANENEIRLLEKFLPPSLNVAQLEALVDSVIKELGVTSRKEMGRVIGALKQRPEADRIDFGPVSRIVASRLA
jgi:uncharacterized protein YqeY